MAKDKNTITDIEKKALTAALRVLYENLHHNPASGRYECQVGMKKISFEVDGHHAIGRVLEKVAGSVV